MNKIESNFIEEYKKLDKLCQDIFSSTVGVTKYIDEMDSSFSLGNRFIKDWSRNYKMLKHLRWLRNKIVHDPQETDCSLHDINQITFFYQQILTMNDPLARLHQLTLCQQHTNTVSSTNSTSLDAPSPNKRRIVLIVFIILLIFILSFFALYIIK